jgi:very-short-patch-repair endonuclease
VHVVVPGRGGRARQSGIRISRPRCLNSGDLTRHHNIPITTPARTIADLRRILTPPQLRNVIRQAELHGYPLGSEVETDHCRSELEWRFLRLCRRHGLPEPEVNVRVGPYLVDFLWRQQRLIVETDGFRFHRGRQAFDDDRSRDLELRLLGFEVIRLSAPQIRDQPATLALLSRRLESPSTD